MQAAVLWSKCHLTQQWSLEMVWSSVFPLKLISTINFVGKSVIEVAIILPTKANMFSKMQVTKLFLTPV
jgi:hypothetical protein